MRIKAVPIKRKATITESSDEDEDSGAAPVASTSSKKSAPIKAIEISDDDSDDLPPRPSKASSKGKGKGKASSAANQPRTPQDPEVKKLQSLVVACGVRKQWKTEYSKKGLESPASQIQHLKAMLVDLGLLEDDMTLEAAKELGEQRKLANEAAELQGEDVAKGGRGSSRASKTQANKRTRKELNPDASGDEGDSDSSAMEDERKEMKKVDNRAGKNTDVFLAMLGLGPEPKKGKQKRRKRSDIDESS